MNCVSYDPYSDPFYDDKKPTDVDQALDRTLTAIVSQGFKCIRTHNSQYYGIDILTYAQKYKLKVVLGVRMQESWTDIEIRTAKASCQKYPDNVIGIFPTNAPDLGTMSIALNQIRENGGCAGVPFGVVLPIKSYLNAVNESFWNKIDWLGFSEFPYERNFTGLSSRDYLKQRISKLKMSFSKETYKKFRLAETGWPSAGDTRFGNVASVSKAKEYADVFASMLFDGEFKTSWVSYFEFFDASYKRRDQKIPIDESHYGLVYFNESTKTYVSKWDLRNMV